MSEPDSPYQRPRDPSGPGRLYLVLSILYIAFIFYLANLPGSSLKLGLSEGSERILWNLAHVPMYGVLTVLLSLSLPSRWLVVSIASIVAVGNELNQMVVPGRTASFEDLLFNGIGIGMGILLRGLRP